MPTAQKDQFSNFALITVTESAANTLTFKKLETGISLNEKIAWIISRVEYYFTLWTSATFDTIADDLAFGLSVSNTFASAVLLEPTIIDFNYIHRDDIGAAATGWYHIQPLLKDFSSLPGNGIIVPPVPLYLFAKGNGLATPVTCLAKVFYTLLELSVDQYWQLVEARRVLTS